MATATVTSKGQITIPAAVRASFWLEAGSRIEFFETGRLSAVAKSNFFINSLLSENPGFITQMPLVELVWVMQSCYGATKLEIIAILETLLRTQELLMGNTEAAQGESNDTQTNRAAHRSGAGRTLALQSGYLAAALHKTGFFPTNFLQTRTHAKHHWRCVVS